MESPTSKVVAKPKVVKALVPVATPEVVAMVTEDSEGYHTVY